MLPKDTSIMYNFIVKISLKALSISSLIWISSCTKPQSTDNAIKDQEAPPSVTKSEYLKSLPLEINSLFVDSLYKGESTGQENAPFKTIAEAIKKASDGQHIYLRAGSYTNEIKLKCSVLENPPTVAWHQKGGSGWAEP